MLHTHCQISCCSLYLLVSSGVMNVHRMPSTISSFTEKDQDRNSIWLATDKIMGCSEKELNNWLGKTLEVCA